MRIDNDIKLDYDDVLLRPKRSTLTSRKDISLERTFTFLHSPKTWTGVPIMTANMASCGTFSMAETLSKHKIITTFHKYYTIQDFEKSLHGQITKPSAIIPNVSDENTEEEESSDEPKEIYESIKMKIRELINS